MKTFEAIKILMKENNFSAKELARRAKVSPCIIWAIMKHDRVRKKSVGSKSIDKIAAVFGVDEDELYKMGEEHEGR